MLLVERIREIPSCRDVPVVALSGLDSSIERARSASGGFAECLIKPVEVSKLLEVACRFAPSSRSESDLEPGEGHRVLIVDDDPIQRRPLKLGLEKAPRSTRT